VCAEREHSGHDNVREQKAAFVVKHNLTAGADDIFVNGDSAIRGAQSLDGMFKARLFGGKKG
jgi:hypothetical protein